MRRIITIAAFALLATSAASAQSLGGLHTVDGTNADGSKYAGVAEIKAPSDSDCKIHWEIAGSTFDGTCERKAKSLAVEFMMSGRLGVGAYEIRADGSLKGTWTVAGQTGSGTEVLTPKR